MLKINDGQLSTDSGKVLFNNINIEISRGSAHYLSGPNGIGKTTFIKALLNLGHRLSNKEYLFKNYAYLPQIENKDFLLPIRIKDITDSGPLLSQEEIKTPWNVASGGQRKKALLERVLKADRDFYVLDEPYNHLDTFSIKLINQALSDLTVKDKSILIVSHTKPNIESLISWDASQWS